MPRKTPKQAFENAEAGQTSKGALLSPGRISERTDDRLQPVADNKQPNTIKVHGAGGATAGPELDDGGNIFAGDGHRRAPTRAEEPFRRLR